jgi:hypothetical protein
MSQSVWNAQRFKHISFHLLGFTYKRIAQQTTADYSIGGLSTIAVDAWWFVRREKSNHAFQ